MKKMIIVSTCGSCPNYFYKDRYGIEKAHRCKEMLHKKGYKPFDECLSLTDYKHTIDKRCPLENYN